MKRQRYLLLSTSALTFVTALSVLAPSQANACQTVNGAATISSTTACVTWQGGVISVTNSGTITGSNTGILESGSTVGNLTNSGTISANLVGGNDAILNSLSSGVIGTITNNGLISAGSGLINYGSIGAIINSGTIESGSGQSGQGNLGIANNNGTIASISNTGLISGAFHGYSNVNSGGGTTGIFNNAGTLTGGNTGIYNHRGMIQTLTNSGIIDGVTAYGINNDTSGGFGTLTNNLGATIEGAQDAIFNQTSSVSISLLSNAGLMIGSITGIHNSGSIGTLINAGTIMGTTDVGFNNITSVTSFTNSAGGTIHGGATGIENSGVINTLTNGGSISGAVAGIANASTLGTLANNTGGSITGATAIKNSSSLTAISNSGVISGTGAWAILNSGSIGSIVNNAGGTISGGYAIANSGTIGNGVTALTNTGTFIGGIDNTGLMSGNINTDQSLFIAGINGTLSGGTITTNNHDLVFAASSNQQISDAINVGAANTITAAGKFKVAGGVSITGNYAQSSSGILQISVTNSTTYGNLVVSGGATMTNDNVSIVGTLTSGEVFTIVQAQDTAANYTGVLASASGFTAAVTSIVGGGLDSLIVTLSTCANQTISGDTTVSGGICSAIWNAGSLSIASTGIVAGSSTAVSNAAHSVGNLTNTGIINGTVFGIDNTGSIGTITNNNRINGGADAVSNSGTIAAFTNNAGGVISGVLDGVLNSGSIATIINSGVISAGLDTAVSSSGTINNLTNNAGATIAGGSRGINNSGVISTISNSGILSGAQAINNGGGNIGSIINNASGTINGGATGINNTGTISSLVNAGLIEGPHAIASSGTILSALSNSGTIEGNITVAQALTVTGGSAGNLGTLTGYSGVISTITTANHDLTFDANANQFMDDDINVGASNTVFNNGLIRVNATHSITGNYTQGAGATLVVGVTDPTHYGQLIVSGAAIMTNGQVLIAPTSGALANAETFTIVQAATSGTNYNGVVATANGFITTTTSITAGGFEDLIVTLTGNPPGSSSYAQLGQSTGGATGAGVGAALDQIQTQAANGKNLDFVPILTALDALGQTQGAAAEGAAIKQLAPGQLSASVASSNLTATQSMMVIGQHQQNLRSQGNGTVGRSAGSEYKAGNLWMQVSGGMANSTTAGAGFHQDYYGMTFGADYHLTKNATLGLAAGWNRSMARGSNDLSGDGISTSTPEIMGYGTYRMGKAYIDGSAGIGYNMFNQSRVIGFLNQVATSNYSGMQYMGDVEGGYDFAVAPRTTLTPLLGFQAIRTDTDSYTEAGAGAADTSVAHQIIDSYSTLLGGRVTTAIPLHIGSLLPEAKLGWAHDLNHSPVSSNATLAGVNFATSTPRISPDGAEVTLGATLQRSDSLSLRAEYDGDLRSDYQSHTGLLKGSLKF